MATAPDNLSTRGIASGSIQPVTGMAFDPISGAWVTPAADASGALASSVFAPGGATVTLSGTTTTSRAAVPSDAGGARNVRIVSPAGGQVAFLAFGDVTVAATTASMPFLPGTVEVFRLTAAQTHIAIITASSTATVYATPGQGA